MDLSSARALAFALNLSAHGVPATITRPAPNDTPIVTTGIWVPQLIDQQPVGTDFLRREPRRVFAIPRTAVVDVPRYSIVVAPEQQGAVARTWRADGTDGLAVDHLRVILVAA
jgi:hypothetical protein